MMDFQLIDFQLMYYIVDGLQLLMDFQLTEIILMHYIVDGLQLLMDFQLTEFILMEFMLMYLTECSTVISRQRIFKVSSSCNDAKTVNIYSYYIVCQWVQGDLY